MKKTASLSWVLALAFVVSALPLTLSTPARAVSLQEEIDLGKKIDAEVLKETPLYADKTAQEEIDNLGQQLVKNVKRKEIAYHFKVLKDDDLNAFSIPGGYVYFSDHLWNVLRRDERIGVLAHEIVHVDRRHALDAISKLQRRQILLAVLLAAVNANQTWGNVAGIANQLYTLKYSRGDEQQADEIGVDLCMKAGLNPAGLLLSMRKIQRFQTEHGGEPPKIFSSHPPTKERLNYLTQLLIKLNVPIPPENVGESPAPDKVGEVTSVNGNRVAFTSSKPLAGRDVVWLMKPGWDFYYENRTEMPVARGIVSAAGRASEADVWLLPGVKQKQIAPKVAVHKPPVPQIPGGIGKIETISSAAGDVGRLPTGVTLAKFDRFNAAQVVWDPKSEKAVIENVGYIIIADPGSPTGYVAAVRPEYSYAPVGAGSTLVPLTDPKQTQWVGPVISIGSRGRTIEVMPNRQLESGKTYEIAYPAWNPKDSHEDRIIGTATLKSTDKKIVLQLTDFRAGWDISRVRNGFDVYEKAGG